MIEHYIRTLAKMWHIPNLTDLERVKAIPPSRETRRRTNHPRQTDQYDLPSTSCLRRLAKLISEASRGFGFIRFPTLEDSKAFVERNYPMIYLYGNGSSDNDDQAAKVRIAYSRERDDRSRGEKAEGEWTCKIVRHSSQISLWLH